MTFDGLNEYLRKNKKNPLLFIFPPLIMLLIFLFDERYFGENEGYPTWRVALWGIFFLLCVATVCYVLKERARITKYIETEHFKHWLDARIIQSVYYHAGNERHSQARLILSMHVTNTPVAGTIATAQVISVAVQGGGGGVGGYPAIQPMQQPMQQPDAPQIEMY